jgi:hypothetical protein
MNIIDKRLPSDYQIGRARALGGSVCGLAQPHRPGASLRILLAFYARFPSRPGGRAPKQGKSFPKASIQKP